MSEFTKFNGKLVKIDDSEKMATVQNPSEI